MSIFLSADQVIELTGYVKPSKQIEWLKRRGIPHFINAAGRPVVSADLMDKRPLTAYELGPVR